MITVRELINTLIDIPDKDIPIAFVDCNRNILLGQVAVVTRSKQMSCYENDIEYKYNTVLLLDEKDGKL